MRIFLVWFLILVSESTLGLAALQEDLPGLFPPPEYDHSPRVTEIRKALRSNDVASARVSANNLIQLEPANFEGYFWAGFISFQQQKYLDAVVSLRQAQTLDSNKYVLEVLGLSYYFLDQFRLFEFTMQQAIQKAPEGFAPYYWLGRYYVSDDAIDFTRAADYFQKALQRNPKDYLSHYYLGYCYESQRKLDESEREYLRSILLAENFGRTFALPEEGLARLKLLEGRPSDALPHAVRAVSLDPNDGTGHVVLARVYSTLKQPRQAAVEWERAGELSPNDAAPFYHLFRIYSDLGNKEQAASAFAKYNYLIAIYGTY